MRKIRIIYGVNARPRPYKSLSDKDLQARRAKLIATGQLSRELLDLNGEYCLRQLSKTATFK